MTTIKQRSVYVFEKVNYRIIAKFVDRKEKFKALQ